MVIFTNKCKGSFCEESPLHLFFVFLMHKQHPQTAYRKYAVLIGIIFENCDKKTAAVQRRTPERQLSFLMEILLLCACVSGCAVTGAARQHPRVFEQAACHLRPAADRRNAEGHCVHQRCERGCGGQLSGHHPAAAQPHGGGTGAGQSQPRAGAGHPVLPPAGQHPARLPVQPGAGHHRGHISFWCC